MTNEPTQPDDTQADEVATEPAAAAEASAPAEGGVDLRKGLTARQAFITLAVVLIIALIALIVFLLLLLRPEGFTARGGQESGGLRPILVIAGPGEGENPLFDRPLGVALGPNGRIYVSDTGNNRVTVFDDDGSFLFEFGEFGVAKPLPGAQGTWEEGKLNFPLGIEVDEDSNVYVADFRNDQVQVFDRNGEFLRRFPDPQQVVGKGASGQDGLGIAVTDIAVHEGHVYALDTYQVLVFTTDGELVRQFGRPGTDESGLDHPNGIDVTDDGTVVVSDSNHNRVSAFTLEGEPLWTLGEPVTSIARQQDYVFGLPRGLTALEGGDTLVVDAFEHELARVSADGELVEKYGSRGTEPAQFNFPNGIDALEKQVVVADKENNRVQLLELLGQ